MEEIVNIVILFIVTSQAQMGEAGKPTGVWMEEVTTPYYTFVGEGYEVVVASPRGGEMPVDPRSLEGAAVTDSVVRFQEDAKAQKLFSNTIPLSEIEDSSQFDAVFLPGGHGPMWDLANSAKAGSVIVAVFESGKPIGAVCHGPAGLLPAKDDEGNWIFANRRRNVSA